MRRMVIKVYRFGERSEAEVYWLFVVVVVFLCVRERSIAGVEE